MPYDYNTSLPAYKEPKDKCRQIVFTAIRKLGIINDRQLSEYLDWPINRITGRRGELVKAGLVEFVRRDKDATSSRTVNFWQEKKVK